jgi:IPT/TIG domain-containing protein
MRKFKSIGLCSVLALALSVVSAQGASALPGSGTVLVLKANGQTLPNGALIHVAATAYSFKTKVTVEGTSKKAAKEQEVECSAAEFLEQGKIQRDTAANAWHVVETESVDFCEGEEWFGGHAMQHPLTFSGPNVATDESTVEIFRTEEQLKAEQKEEFEREEPLHLREPKRCVYTTTSAKGSLKQRKAQPLVVKLAGKMALSPSKSNTGCGTKAKWKGTFSLTYKGQPVFASLETAPTVSSVSPPEGPEAGATSVTIGGTGFTGASAVQFGSTNATSFKVNSDSSITAVAPKGSGTVDVTVTTPVTQTATSAADKFTYLAPPTVTEVAPKTGPESGATEVTIKGTNFTSGSTVNFGSTAASSVKMNSSESITAVSPKASGTVHVTVTTAGGTSATSPADEFTFIPGI